MTRLISEERGLLTALSDLTHCNPFETKRIDLERRVLGDAHAEERFGAWSRTEATDRNERPNVVAINALAADLVESLRERQQAGGSLRGDEADLYDDLITYTLYYRVVAPLTPERIDDTAVVAKAFREFASQRERLHAPLEAGERGRLPTSGHAFACLHQVRRAFQGIFGCLIGESAPASRLRAAVWQSVFTHDMRRYRRVLFGRLRDLATLITGPTGSGKELVARAIATSQYRALDEKTGKFVGEGEAFTPLNLSALSPTLIESELFGHRKGSFTGATADRVGWLERCPEHGAVFLDELGELDPAIQVKLLRVAQTRDYSRLGASEPRRFAGKLIAATNRDLAAEMRAGRFREDLYYRLCSDRVVVPSLAEQLEDRPEALGGLVRFFARRVLGGEWADDAEAESLAAEAEAWITRAWPGGYAWPGNARELEQCVRGVLVRGAYQPPTAPDELAKRPGWLAAAGRGELSADELLNAYCRQVHQQQGGYEQAARVLGLDRRTVKSRVTDQT